MSRITLYRKISLLAVFPLLGLATDLAGQTNFTVLKRFSSLSSGFVPYGLLVADQAGVLYGATAAGGVSNAGTVFRVNQDGNGYATLKSFLTTDGTGPQTGLALNTNGVLFGTTYIGGISNFGTFFQINKDGTGFQILH